MKGRILFVSFVLIFGMYSIIADESEKILGRWLTHTNQSIVELYNKENVFYGKIVWISSDKKINTLGLEMIKGLIYDSKKNTWTGGMLYGRERDKWYYCSVKLKDDDTIEIRISIDKNGIFGSNKIWKRKK